MPVVRMHIDSAEALADGYGRVAGQVRDAMAELSPLLTEALALLDMAGQHPVYGPMPALTETANGLTDDKADLAWRVDLLRSNDELRLDAIRLGELNDAIANWNGTDNDALLDALLRERRELLEEIGDRDPSATDVDPDILELAALHGVSYAEAFYSVTTATIDELTNQIDSWDRGDNALELDALIAERDAQIALLTEGDDDLSAMFLASLFAGKTANEAATDLLTFISEETRIEAVMGDHDVSREHAEALLAQIDAGFDVLAASGIEGAELETATHVLYWAVTEGHDFDEITNLVETRGIDHETAAGIVANAEVYGLTGEEFLALKGFGEHFDTFDNAQDPNAAAGSFGYNASYMSTSDTVGTNGQVNIHNLRYVVDNPNQYSADEVSAAQALLDQPQLLARIDTASHTDLFPNDGGFGSTTADDQNYSIEDLINFENKQFAFAQLDDHRFDIDVAHQGGAVDGHLSKSDYQAFLDDNFDDLTAAEVEALEIVIGGDLFDQTWWEENKNSLAMASALVAAGAFTAATGGFGGVVVAGLVGGTAAAGTTVAINATSDNLDLTDDLASNSFNGALVGVGTATAPASFTALRAGATPGARILGATELTAEVTGTIALGTLDPVLRPILGQENLDGVKDGTGAVSAITGIGSVGAHGVRWVNTRARVTAYPADLQAPVQRVVNRNWRAADQFLDGFEGLNDGLTQRIVLNNLDDDTFAALAYESRVPRIAEQQGIDPHSAAHLIDGEVKQAKNGNLRAVGGHFEDSPNFRIVGETWLDETSGLPTAMIEVFDPGAGQWVPKKAPSTLFPSTWDEERVLSNVQEAFDNSVEGAKPNQWVGETSSGHTISGYYLNNTSSPTAGWSTAWFSGGPK